MTWRERFRPQIIALLDARQGATVTELKQVFREAWSHGPRRGRIYTAWRREIAEICAERGLRGVTRRAKSHRKAPRMVKTAKNRAKGILSAAERAAFEARQMRLL